MSCANCSDVSYLRIYFSIMRLLNCRRLLNGQLASEAIEDYYDGDQPPYAILSHTWGKEEVSLQDLAQPEVSRKEGFQKIRYCCEQSLKDNLEFAWVDTCCIDKSSSAELSEAINSMFRWYLNARVCYAYLQDVATVYPGSSGPGPEFYTSKWFTRGWTLQELLAPDAVVFYTASWQKIGTKKELIGTLSQITNIDSYFLGPEADTRLRYASIAQKMSWASKRTTTRVEDIAYSLLGIFDISLPLLYGESTRAFTRLQEKLIEQYHDHSIFAWGLSGSGRTSGLFAASPADFRGCEDIIPFHWRNDVPAPSRIPRGVQIHVHLVGHKVDLTGNGSIFVYALLNCYVQHSLHKVLAIPLHTWDAGRSYKRGKEAVDHLEPLSGPFQRPKSISVMDSNPRTGHFMWIQHLPKHYRLAEVVPPSLRYLRNPTDALIKLSWRSPHKQGRLVRIVDDKHNRTLVLDLSIKRSISSFGLLCPFSWGRTIPSCKVAIIGNHESLQDIAKRKASFKWQEEPRLLGVGRVMVDIRAKTVMGWDMLAVRIYIVQGAGVWQIRARKFVTQLRPSSSRMAAVELGHLLLFIFLLWIFMVLIQRLHVLFCYLLSCLLFVFYDHYEKVLPRLFRETVFESQFDMLGKRSKALEYITPKRYIKDLDAGFSVLSCLHSAPLHQVWFGARLCKCSAICIINKNKRRFN